MARDQGTPQQTGTAMVTVSVDRNKYSPVFSRRDYSTPMANTFTPSLPLITVTAADADIEVRKTFVSISPMFSYGSLLFYFIIHM